MPRDSETPVFSESWVPFGIRTNGDRVYRGGPGLAVRVGDRKLVRYSGLKGAHTMYFDLARDPREERDLSTDPNVRKDVEELRALLVSSIDPSIDTKTKFQRKRQGRAPAVPAFDLDAEHTEKLRALGYIE